MLSFPITDVVLISYSIELTPFAITLRYLKDCLFISKFSHFFLVKTFVTWTFNVIKNRLKRGELYCIDGVVIAALMHCDLFEIYWAPLNLGITRTSICRLNFAQRPIFSGLRFFNEPKILDSGSPAPLPEDLCSGFLRPEKIHRPQSGLNPRTLDLEASTLPRDHRGRRHRDLIINPRMCQIIQLL